MSIELYVIILIVALSALYFVVPVVAGTYLKYRGKRVITCPETRKAAAVEMDAGHAALTAGLRYPELRLKTCTRWPEREGCGQACLLQIRLSPEDCLIGNILTKLVRRQRLRILRNEVWTDPLVRSQAGDAESRR